MKKIGIVGVESTGKSTLALMLTGRLRTHGVLAALVAESGSELPFSPTLLDTSHDAHAYMISAKLAAEARASLRPNVGLIVSDRTPLDHAAYYMTKLAETVPMATLCAAAMAWTRETYSAIYYLPAAGVPYREDGFRQPAMSNIYRDRVDERLSGWLKSLAKDVHVEFVPGNFRQRCEYVYHHVLAQFLGKTRPVRAYQQVEAWLRSRGWDVVEVRPQGSNSVTRFHPSSDHDDIDAIVVVRGGADYAVKVREDFQEHREQVENIVQASLDLLITPAGMEAHET